MNIVSQIFSLLRHCCAALYLVAEVMNVSDTLLLTQISHLPASVMRAGATRVPEVTDAAQIDATRVTRLKPGSKSH